MLNIEGPAYEKGFCRISHGSYADLALVCNKGKYSYAVADVKSGNYDKAIEVFEALSCCQDSDKYILYAKCLKAGDSGEFDAYHDFSDIWRTI